MSEEQDAALEACRLARAGHARALAVLLRSREPTAWQRVPGGFLVVPRASAISACQASLDEIDAYLGGGRP